MKDLGMKERLNTIRKNAIAAKEGLSEGLAGHEGYIFKLDRIIRGTRFVIWLHRLAASFFVLFAVFFVAMLYPSVKSMLIMLGIAVCGYGVSLGSIFVQMKLYERTIFKVESLTLREVTFCDHGG